jgi:hypothetical protein
LIELPENPPAGGKKISEPEVSELTKDEITTDSGKELSFHIFLEKALMRVKILTLKFENKTSNWLESLRHQNKNKDFNDNYWEELKKVNRNKKKNKDN